MKAFLKSLLVLSVVWIVSCCSIGEDRQDKGVNGQTGQVTFGFDQAGLGPRSGIGGPQNAPAVSAIVVTITDGAGNAAYNAITLPVINMNGGYITGPLTLAAGSYNLTQFLATDASGTALYAAPLEGSPLAHLVNIPLPINFTVGINQVSKLIPEVLATAASTPADFGYATFAFNIVDTIDFLVAVMIFNQGSSNFELSTAAITVTSGGTSLFSGTLPAAATAVKVRDGYTTYNVTVTKPGYADYAHTFTGAELKSYESVPLVITLNTAGSAGFGLKQLIVSPVEGASFSKDSVAFSGDGNTLAIGTINENSAGGAVYVYQKSNGSWTFNRRLAASDGEGFSSRLSLNFNGNIIAIGANGAKIGSNYSQGAVYVYTKSGSTWGNEKKIYVGNGSTGDLFGNTVSISGDGNTIVVGAVGYDSLSGAVYYCTQTNTNWSEPIFITKGQNRGISYLANSGQSISYDGSIIVIGAQGDNSSHGASYIYSMQNSIITLLQTINAPVNENYFYPNVVSSDGSTIIISGSVVNSNTGAVYIYSKSGGTYNFSRKITIPDGQRMDKFGLTISISSSGNKFIVGAPGMNSNTGATYVFSKENGAWDRYQLIAPPIGSQNDCFGYSVYIDENASNVVVGAYGVKSANNVINTGAAYIYN